jgi:hypothetical protein
VNQHTTIKKAVFSVEAASTLYNEDIRQLDSIESPKFAVGTIIDNKWQERHQAVQRRLHNVLQLQ